MVLRFLFTRLLRNNSNNTLLQHVRGNRTDIDVGGTDNTDLTFNIADRLTRVDYEDNSYRIYTHDDNGNCIKEEFYSGQYLASPVVVPTDTILSSPTFFLNRDRLQPRPYKGISCRLFLISHSLYLF